MKASGSQGKGKTHRAHHRQEEQVTRVTRDEARHMRSRTDWDRVNAMTEAEIEANAAADPENPPWTTEMMARAQWVAPVEKQAVSIRLDRDILAFLKQEGPGYQSRINAILRTYVTAKMGR